MSLKSFIIPRAAEKLLGEAQVNKQRAKFERSRLINEEAHKIEFFHDPADPYSQLLEKVLPQLTENYKIELITHLVSPPDETAAPERDKLVEYSKMDAIRLAKKAGIDFVVQDRPSATNTIVSDTRRKKLGHYLGGTLYYGGEWYWGLDRLHYLEDRLTQLGARKDGAGGLIYEPPTTPVNSGNTGAEIHWYLSFRSPYTAIVRDRVKVMADAYGADLKLRFVLPMVMRGLPVNPTKKTYIPFDTAREARRLNVPFGRVMDPVGRPVELGYSLLPWAREQGRGYAFVNAFLSCVWSEGTDAGSHKGLQKIVERAGLSWNEAKSIVGNENWRAEAEANRLEMLEHGIWGVPSFRVGNTITWGQDRLWVVEHALQKFTDT